MELFWNDPDTGEKTTWWSIDPETGERDEDASPAGGAAYCLGDCPLAAVGQAADAIETTFAVSRCFSEGEIRALLVERLVPPSFQGGPEDAGELLQLIEGLWEGVERCYQLALNRSANSVERRWLYVYALSLLRPRSL